MKFSSKWTFCSALVLTGTTAIGGLLAVGYAATKPVEPQPARPIAVTATTFVQRDILVNGMRLRYIDEGSGAAVLLIPGHASRLEEYEALTWQLRSSFRVIVADLPGSGYSDKPDRQYDLRFYEDTIMALLDALSVRTCVVAGGSLGGNLTLRLAHRFPERFDGAAAWAPASAWEAQPRLAAFIRFVGGRTLFWPTVRIQTEFWYSDGNSDADKNRGDAFSYFEEVMSPGFLQMYWGIAADQVGTSLFDIAPGIVVPVLLISGELDSTPAMHGGLRRLSAEIPHARLVVIADSGHAISLERPDALVENFSRFLRDRTRQ